MWMVIGALCGVFLGLAFDSGWGTVVFALFAGFVGWAKDRHDRRGEAALTSRLSGAVQERALLTVLQRLEAVEGRLAQVEARLGLEAPPAAPADARAAEGALHPPSAAATTVATPEPATVPRPEAMRVPPPRPEYGVPRTPAPQAEEAAPSLPAAHRRVLPEWLAGGNTLTRVGIVILFFGVAFLLRYFAEIAGVPIEAKLGAAALGGLALAALGLRLRHARPAYGLSLEGAGMGIVYLTVFAAFRLYEVLAPVPAIVLLVAIAGATVVLALRHDSQALAALAFAGGFLAPILIETGADSPIPLFAWFAVLDGAIFAIAWRRSWRALDVLGFVFTFALGLVWGWSFYRPSHFAAVQPFLVLFFLFYVGIAILHARARSDEPAPVDGVLVFGVPLVGFALQAGLVRDVPYGAAWSAAVLAGFYAVLWYALRPRAEIGLARLARGFLALAVVFATLTVPLELDARWTSAGWAIEAAAVYGLALVQRQRFARWFAIALHFAGALAYLWESPAPGGVFLANAAFLGMALIGASALTIVAQADRRPEALGALERKLLWPLFAWGALWWLGAGVSEVQRVARDAVAVNGSIAWVSGSAAIALAAGQWLRWPRGAWLFAFVLPALDIGGWQLIDLERTTLAGYGVVVWPLAWLVHFLGLRGADAALAGASPQARGRLRDVHVVSALAFVAWLAWEASEWTGRATPHGTVWIACAAALPAIVYLLLVTRLRSSTAWPLRDHAEAYGRGAGTLVAVALAVWFLVVNVISPGDPRPLPHVPLATPLDLVLLAALVALWRWSGAWGRMTLPQRVGAAALGAFVAVNGLLVRVAHHWGHVPWNREALFAYRPLQVTLTLAWTVCALAAMLFAHRRSQREVWLAGAALLAVVVAKLFLLDLAALSGLARVIAFLGTGVLLLVIGYAAPLPPPPGAPKPT
jgi:uncharacterized membrane protein